MAVSSIRLKEREEREKIKGICACHVEKCNKIFNTTSEIKELIASLKCNLRHTGISHRAFPDFDPVIKEVLTNHRFTKDIMLVYYKEEDMKKQELEKRKQDIKEEMEPRIIQFIKLIVKTSYNDNLFSLFETDKFVAIREALRLKYGSMPGIDFNKILHSLKEDYIQQIDNFQQEETNELKVLKERVKHLEEIVQTQSDTIQRLLQQNSNNKTSTQDTDTSIWQALSGFIW